MFAWSYQEMPEQDTDIVAHLLTLKKDSRPIKQRLKRTRPDMEMKIEEEVQK